MLRLLFNALQISCCLGPYTLAIAVHTIVICRSCFCQRLLSCVALVDRSKGTYGAAISAATGSFPGPQTPIKGLYRCGDSTQPGIGVPAAAASGMICANTLVPVWEHLGLLNALKL